MTEPQTTEPQTTERSVITVRSLLIGTLFAILFAVVTVYFENRKDTCLVATQVAPAPYVLLFAMVFLLNPLCRVLRVVRRFTVTEVLVVFVMGSVSAGIATFGMASQLVPVIGNLFNQHWNTDQAEWNIYVEPFVNEAFFISESGIRPAARRRHTELFELRGLQKEYDAAFNFRRTREAESRARQALAAVQGGAPEVVSNAEIVLQSAGRAQAEAATRWEKLRTAADLPDFETVLATYPDKINAQQEQVKARRAELAALEEKAFERVALFRRGLPKDLRAFPGFVPVPGESFNFYSGRLRRLRAGVKAHRRLRAARTLLADGASAEDVRKAQQLTAAAVGLLEPLRDEQVLLAEKGEIARQWDAENQTRIGVREELRQARVARRTALAKEFSRWDRLIRRLKKQDAALGKKLKELNHDKEQVEQQLRITARVAETVTEMRETASQLADAPPAGAALAGARERLSASMARFPGIDASWRRFLIGDVPWSHWLKPTLLWTIVIGLMYVLLMSFNVLIFRQWAYNERLIYPLAELPEALAGHTDEDTPDSWVPILCRDPLFWVGFGVSFCAMGWNLLCYTGWAPGLAPLDLRNSWWQYTRNSPFQGLTASGNCHVFFTLIGLTFMVPANISFSVWFFYVLYMLQLLIMVWAGYGVSEASFPTGWWHTLNFRSAEGSGAMLVFAAVVLFKCRKYLFCFFTPSSIGELERPEQKELRIASLCFMVSSVGVVVSLWLGLGANLYWTIFMYFVMMVITIALIRAVAEGGILGLQANVSPFHLIRSLFGMDKSWTSPSLFAPLMIFYSVLFLDLKTFIAPSMANAMKMRDDAKMGRGRFHIAIALALVCATAASVYMHIAMSYSGGADCMRRWFHTTFPRILYGQVCATAKTMPIDTAGGCAWLAVGAVLMTALLYFRRMVFWLPHPIGFIMLANPMMNRYWFSIFLAWLAKSVVTKYGNKDTYKRARRFFVGLILGELAIVVLAIVVSYVFDLSIRLNLNR